MPPAVAASDINLYDARAYFSNYAATRVHIAAPGVNILSTYKDNDSSYVLMSGTSMATPVTAGAAALLFAAKPDATMAEVRWGLGGRGGLERGLQGVGGRVHEAEKLEGQQGRRTCPACPACTSGPRACSALNAAGALHAAGRHCWAALTPARPWLGSARRVAGSTWPRLWPACSASPHRHTRASGREWCGILCGTACQLCLPSILEPVECARLLPLLQTALQASSRILAIRTGTAGPITRALMAP